VDHQIENIGEIKRGISWKDNSGLSLDETKHPFNLVKSAADMTFLKLQTIVENKTGIHCFQTPLRVVRKNSGVNAKNLSSLKKNTESHPTFACYLP
jgi:hypothetical protein